MSRFKFRFFVEKLKRVMSACEIDNFDTASAILGEEIGIIPMQWTGLRDINGVDVYESDIVACIKDKFAPGRHEYWEIVYGYFGDAAFYVSNQVNSGRTIDYDCSSNVHGFSISGTDWVDCEVIGNIYENPEMVR